MRVSVALPLAVLAAIATLFCSSYILGETNWSRASRVSVTMLPMSPDAQHPTPPNGGLADAAAAAALATPEDGDDSSGGGGGLRAASRKAVAPPPSPAVVGCKRQVELPLVGAPFPASDYSASFLVARRVTGRTADQTRALLKTMLGLASLLGRSVVLPIEVCDCTIPEDGAAGTCTGEGPAPFDCPLAVPLDPAAWTADTVGGFRVPPLKPARFLTGTLPEDFVRSHVRVLLPDGLDDSEAAFALRGYKDTRWLEVDNAATAFCGWDTRMPGNSDKMSSFLAAADRLLSIPHGSPATLHACTHYRGGTGEVVQFTNLGQSCDRHDVLASEEKLPPAVRALPKGSDLMVTFATGSVATMALNWVRTTQAAGVSALLIGALDQSMMDACEQHQLPCILIEGGAVTAALQNRKAGNVRSDPALYPKMSVLKVGFYRELLTFGYNVWACDADAVFMRDPRPLMSTGGYVHADVAIATDCIDVPADSRSPLLHCDFNTGLVYLRSKPATIEFAERWRETVANAKEHRIRDQAAFNMLTKVRRPQPLSIDGVRVPRVFTVTAGTDGAPFNLAVLPLSRFLNGHTFFVQHVHTLPEAEPALSVHMTYQFAEGRSFAYGKRQRLREHGLWLVDTDDYFNGKYITVSSAGATLPFKPMGSSVDSRDAVAYHLAEAEHRTQVIRSLLGIGKALGREVILPRMLCYCDFMWKEMQSCRVGGAETMRLPFDCPMDHVLNTPNFFGEFVDGQEGPNPLGVGVREPAFLSNPRVPAATKNSTAAVSLSGQRGLTDGRIKALLAPYAGAGVIVLDDAVDVFCGFEDPATNKWFVDQTAQMLHYSRTPFCTMEGSDNAPLFSQCCSPRKPGDKFFPCVYGFDPPDPLPTCSAAPAARRELTRA